MQQIAKEKILKTLDVLRVKGGLWQSAYDFVFANPNEYSTVYDILYTGIVETIKAKKQRLLEQSLVAAKNITQDEDTMTDEDLALLLKDI